MWITGSRIPTRFMNTFEDGKFEGCEPRDVDTQDLGWIKRTTYSYNDRELASDEIARRRELRNA